MHKDRVAATGVKNIYLCCMSDRTRGFKHTVLNVLVGTGRPVNERNTKY